MKRDLIVIGLTDDERKSVLKALADPPPGLEDVRDTLLAEQDPACTRGRATRRRDGGLRATSNQPDVANVPHSRYIRIEMPIVAGIRLTREETLELAGILTRHGSDRAARLLLHAVTNAQRFVALTADDKEDVLAALTRRPTTLVEVRRALFDELNWQREGLAPPRCARGIESVASRREREHVNVAWV